MKKDIILLLFLSLLIFSKPICSMNQKKKLISLQKSSLQTHQDELAQIMEKISLKKNEFKNSWNNLKGGDLCGETSKIAGHLFACAKLYLQKDLLQIKIDRRQESIHNCHH